MPTSDLELRYYRLAVEEQISKLREVEEPRLAHASQPSLKPGFAEHVFGLTKNVVCLCLFLAFFT